MESTGGVKPAAGAVYDRVVREARLTIGHILDDATVEQAAQEAVDRLLVLHGVRLTTFVPVLALRRLRETIGPGRPGQ